jgi:hypothetical protein
MSETKEWTLMFYFASDNPLAISAVSQLKAIKDAGFHPDANVVTQFDPYTEGTPTHVFDVNLINKLKNPKRANIGFSGKDPSVRSMIEDKLWRDERTSPETAKAAGVTAADGELVRTALHRVLRDKWGIDYNPPVAPDVNHRFQAGNGRIEEPDPKTTLKEFLQFCANKYPARHYMLFMLGHGVVVGNDVFMLDEHASEQSLTLTQLREILDKFKETVALKGAAFELLSFHSCSVSSLEVAYEVKDTAKYMLASQGPAFVGSWPYRQILIRIFNALSSKKDINVRDLLFEIYNSCLLNSADYLLAGYSFQLTLCDLERIETLTGAINELAQALVDGLENDVTSKDFILLSHWKSQSFFNEMYTDLYDFCFCFSKKLEEFINNGGRPTQRLLNIHFACGKVMDKLVKENPKKEGHPELKQIIVAADSMGPAYQYSRGLSVYFPWAEPSHDHRILAEYENYKFTTEFKDSWLEFLRSYFKNTMRDRSSDEADHRRFLPLLPKNGKVPVEEELDKDIASLIYSGEGLIDRHFALSGPKSDPTDRTGGDYEGVSIKNFPHDTRSRRVRMREAIADTELKFSLTEAFGLTVRNGNNGKH